MIFYLEKKNICKTDVKYGGSINGGTPIAGWFISWKNRK
jgi:hypothetical protein